MIEEDKGYWYIQASDGEQQETQYWIETAFDCSYISQEEANALLEKYTEVSRLLGGMMAKVEMFCRPSPYKIQEEQAVYFVETDPDPKP